MVRQAISKQMAIRKVILVKLDEKVLKFYCCDVDLIFQHGANYGNNFVARFEDINCSESRESIPVNTIWNELGHVLAQY